MDGNRKFENGILWHKIRCGESDICYTWSYCLNHMAAILKYQLTTTSLGSDMGLLSKIKSVLVLTSSHSHYISSTQNLWFCPNKIYDYQMAMIMLLLATSPINYWWYSCKTIIYIYNFSPGWLGNCGSNPDPVLEQTQIKIPCSGLSDAWHHVLNRHTTLPTLFT